MRVVVELSHTFCVHKIPVQNALGGDCYLQDFPQKVFCWIYPFRFLVVMPFVGFSGITFGGSPVVI
jgi:hypothetical protein